MHFNLEQQKPLAIGAKTSLYVRAFQSEHLM